MFATSTILLATALGGLATNTYGQMKGAKEQKKMSQASYEAEQARKKQAALQYQREQRKIFRDAQAANAVGLSNITNANAQFGTALGGLYGQTAGSVDQQSYDLAQNAKLGENIFDANSAYAQAQGRYATAQGIAQLGKDIFAASGSISRVGSSIFGGPGADQGIHDWNRGTTVTRY